MITRSRLGKVILDVIAPNHDHIELDDVLASLSDEELGRLQGILDWYEHHGEVVFLNPAYRSYVQNLEIPEVLEGYRISQNMFLAMDEQAREAGVELVIIFIPTKEFVFAELVEQNSGLSQIYHDLVANESYLRKDLLDFLSKNGIKVVDTYPSLQIAVRDNSNLYPSTFDGHPLPYGYQIMGESIAHELYDYQP